MEVAKEKNTVFPEIQRPRKAGVSRVSVIVISHTPAEFGTA